MGRLKTYPFFFYFYRIKFNIMDDKNTAQLLRALGDLKVGGVTKVVKVTGVQVGVSGAAYASGDVLGDMCPIKVELVRSTSSGYGSGVIQSIITQDLSNQSGAYDIVVFDSNPTATTFTDNAALDIADVDLPKVIDIISIAAADYKTFADSTVGVTTNLARPIQSISGPSVWIALVSRDAKTYVADELSISIGVLQD